MASSKLVAKFRGCLMGGLIGDCFGAPFEWDNPVSKIVLQEFLSKKLETKVGTAGGAFQVLPYTDDTEMARSVAESLILKNGFEAEDMAERFSEEYFRPIRPKRSYGTHVTYVFKRFKEKSYEDIFEPAKNQFDGAGSFGNGAAMRTHPIALFCFNKDRNKLFDICRKAAQLTHSHLDGYNGAILQTLAVLWALNAEPDTALDPHVFIDDMIKSMKDLESMRASDVSRKHPSLCSQLESVKNLISKPELSPQLIGDILGNNVTATKSVPTAIYSFLRAREPLQDFKSDNPFLRTLYLAIAVGGDTDTIASMACSIAGAYYGVYLIPEQLQQQCEAWKDVLMQADRLAHLASAP